uniref:histidinol dehydrogenase n=1 Tax=Brassica oleracea var. oleracea TaxID=109376 RepID=A0A0D3ACH0_BRAOL
MATDKSSSLLLFRCRTTLDSNSVFSLRTSVTKSKGKFYCLFSGGNQKENSEAIVSIDMPAGPSEVLVIADEHASPVYIAADLLSQAITFSNLYAPEHLIINVKDAEKWEGLIENACSVFIGPWTPESVGDYASGTNHVLPTYGYARMYSGVSLDSFLKFMTVQSLTEEGLRNLGPYVATMAEIEGLDAHKRAVTLRLEDIEARQPSQTK